jgi:4-hydroxy-tetrahydrodipicolinate synthase
MAGKAWHGVLVATALPMRADLSVDLDAYAEHVAWLAANGCDGVAPNGSLGEYQTLSDDERAAVVRTAVEAAPEAGAPVVMMLPPNTYKADEETVVEHYRTVAQVGIPILAYNNPFDTKVDLTPKLLARLYHEGLIVAVKEFTGDPRRAYEIAELAPGLDILIGSDDVVLEVALAGAVGWVAGFTNSLPRSTVELYKACLAGDLETALPLYRALHPLLRWDSKTEFVQAIKVSMDVVGRYGGPCRPPRSPLSPQIEAEIRHHTEKAIAAGMG